MYIISFFLILSFLLIFYINYLNILYYDDKPENIDYYLGKDLKLDKDFKSLEYKDKKYYRFNNYIYYNQTGLYLTYKHPFFKVDDIVYKELNFNSHNIPKIIWQTLDKNPQKDSELYNLTNRFKNQQGWKYNFVSDSEAEKFIQKNFDPLVLKTFKILVPGAFKADLLRACLLYIHGGVYADIKLKLLAPLDSFLDNDLILVKEINRPYKKNTSRGIWNGFMASIPRQEYFKNIIDNIVRNVYNKYYATDTSKLSITGPVLYGKNFLKTFKTKDIKSRENITILNASDLSCYDEKNYISKDKDFQMLLTWSKKRNYLKNFKNDYSKLYKEKKIYDLGLHKKYFN